MTTIERRLELWRAELEHSRHGFKRAVVEEIIQQLEVELNARDGVEGVALEPRGPGRLHEPGQSSS